MSIWDKWKEKLSSASSLFNKWFGRSKNSTTTKNTDATTAATATDSKLLNSQTKTTQTIPSPNVTPENNNITPENKNVAPKQQVTEAPAADSSVPTQQNTSGSDDRFLNWYKEQFGKDYTEGSFNKTEGMSDKDYETGNNLYQAYIQKQNLEKQHNSAMQSVDESTARQRQEASILRDKMSKYLNLQNKNNGLNNLGVSESVGLQADSQYMNNLGSIEANANTEKTNLLNNYFNNKTNIDSEAASNEQNILDKYQKYEREDEQKAYDRQQDEYNKKKYEEEQAYQREQDEYNKKKSAQDSAYSEVMATIESGSFNTTEELESFYQSMKDKLSPEQQLLVEQQINFYKNNPDQQQADSDIESNKPTTKDNGDGTKTTTKDNGDGTVTETTTDQNGNKTTETKLKVDTSSGHNRYTSKSGVTISSPTDNHLNITYGSNNNDHANNYDITYNGNKYKVEVGKEFAGTNDQLQEIYKYMRQTSGRNDIREGDCVLYDGELYIASNTGRLWTVQDRSKFWAWNWGGKTASDLKALFKTNFG